MRARRGTRTRPWRRPPRHLQRREAEAGSECATSTCHACCSRGGRQWRALASSRGRKSPGGRRSDRAPRRTIRGPSSLTVSSRGPPPPRRRDPETPRDTRTRRDGSAREQSSLPGMARGGVPCGRWNARAPAVPQCRLPQPGPSPPRVRRRGRQSQARRRTRHLARRAHAQSSLAGTAIRRWRAAAGSSQCLQIPRRTRKLRAPSTSRGRRSCQHTHSAQHVRKWHRQSPHHTRSGRGRCSARGRSNARCS